MDVYLVFIYVFGVTNITVNCIYSYILSRSVQLYSFVCFVLLIIFILPVPQTLINEMNSVRLLFYSEGRTRYFSILRDFVNEELIAQYSSQSCHVCHLLTSYTSKRTRMRLFVTHLQQNFTNLAPVVC